MSMGYVDNLNPKRLNPIDNVSHHVDTKCIKNEKRNYPWCLFISYRMSTAVAAGAAGAQ